MLDNKTKILYPIVMSAFLKSFGKKLKGYRISNGLSQEKLAELSNVSTNTISMLENGKTFIKYKNLCSICKVLKIQEIDLFSFSMPKSQNISIMNQIIAKIKLLEPNKQKQILDIIKTFE